MTDNPHPLEIIMPEKPEILTNVPAGRVGKIVQGFIDDGAVDIKCAQQPDEDWTITASYTRNDNEG